MAQFITAGAVPLPGSVGAYLREALPDEYIVVGEPALCGQAVEAVVIGPSAVILLRVVAGEGEQTPAAYRERESQARLISTACQRFLRDEFPGLSPLVRHFFTRRKDEAEPPVWYVTGPGGVTGEALEDAIRTTNLQAGPAWADEDTRETVAIAMRDRRLTASQRASKPFVFRSGGPFGTGTRVWTIRDAVRHMDHHPDDGIYHLRNGTLAAWLEEEGAPHLARLARDAVSGTKTDYRAGLETFLLSTGLVERPRLAFRPKVVDLGYVIEGESSARALHVRKGRGRGYLFGDLTTSDPWLHVEPRMFEGKPAEIIVSAETRALPISPKGYAAEVHITSMASEQPVPVPVRLRVVARPPRLVRGLIRPLAGLLFGAILGAGIGWLWSWAGIPVPAGIIGAGPPVSAGAIWAVVVGTVWAIFGLVRGVYQPPAWPAAYALGRWMIRLLLWSAVLALLAVAVVWFWRLGLQADLDRYAVVYARAALIGAALGVIPASMGETLAAQRASDPRIVKGRQRARRWALIAILVALLLLGVLAAPRTVVPAWQRLQAVGAVARARASIVAGWERANGIADRLIEQYYLKYYDRRAPAGPTPAPSPVRGSPTPVGTAPAPGSKGG